MQGMEFSTALEREQSQHLIIIPPCVRLVDSRARVGSSLFFN